MRRWNVYVIERSFKMYFNGQLITDATLYDDNQIIQVEKG